MPDSTFNQPVDKKRHPDGVHRNQHGHAIYIVPGEEHTALCSLCRQRVEGWPFQRTTTFISVLESSFGLERWKLRQVVKGMTIKEHLQIKAAGSLDSDESLDKIAEQALEAADTSSGADMGTGVHGLTEALDRGEDVRIPGAVKADVLAYQRMLEVQRLKPVEIEVNVVIDGWAPTKTTRGISGRFDRIMSTGRMCPACQTDRYIFDLKTGKSVNYDARKIPMQLATYAMASRYNAATGERSNLDVCQCIGLVLHLPVGKGEATLFAADLAGGLIGLQLASQVWDWRMRDDLLVEVPDAPEPAPDTSQSTSGLPAVAGLIEGNDGPMDGPRIHALIKAAQTVDTVREVWREYAGHEAWALDHKAAALARVKELQA